jgi:hypothetical protein
MGGDGGVDQVAAQAPQARERALLVGAGEPAEADDVGGEDRRKFPTLRHVFPPQARRAYHNRESLGSAFRKANVTVGSGPSAGPATNLWPNGRSCALAHPARSAYTRFLAFSAHTGLLGKVSKGSIPEIQT